MLFLQGHKNTIGDITFQPKSATELGSVGDDCALLFWDTRVGASPVTKVESAHKKAELRCIDWSSQEIDLIATGRDLSNSSSITCIIK